MAMKSLFVCLTFFIALSIDSSAQTTGAATPAGDGGWPRAYTTASGAHVLIYQPQIESWPDQKKLTMYSAVSYQKEGEPKPALGTLKIVCDTSVAKAERLVDLTNITIAEASFPTLGTDAVRPVVTEIVAAIPRQDRVISLDRLLAGVDTSQLSPKNTEGLKADPPKVFVSETPAVVVNLDGDPIWSPIPGNDLKFAVNTNWDLFEDPT